MLLCEKCFHDEVCRELVQSTGTKVESLQGVCAVCGQPNPMYCYDTSSLDSLNAGFEDLLRIYTPESSLSNRTGRLPGIAEEIQNRWRIFNENIPFPTVLEILKELAPALAADEKAKKIFSEPVGIKDIIENNLENLSSVSLQVIGIPSTNKSKRNVGIT